MSSRLLEIALLSLSRDAAIGFTQRKFAGLKNIPDHNQHAQHYIKNAREYLTEAIQRSGIPACSDDSVIENLVHSLEECAYAMATDRWGYLKVSQFQYHDELARIVVEVGGLVEDIAKWRKLGSTHGEKENDARD